METGDDGDDMRRAQHEDDDDGVGIEQCCEESMGYVPHEEDAQIPSM